jgi:hypothetical protein
MLHQICCAAIAALSAAIAAPISYDEDTPQNLLCSEARSNYRSQFARETVAPPKLLKPPGTVPRNQLLRLFICRRAQG